MERRFVLSSLAVTRRQSPSQLVKLITIRYTGQTGSYITMFDVRIATGFLYLLF